MSAAEPLLAPLSTDDSSPALDARQATLRQLRDDLVHRFPGAVIPTERSVESLARRAPRPRSPLHQAPFAWIEVGVGEGGLAWLSAWTLMQLASDPLGRPALWIDTHRTYKPGELLDLSGRLVVVQPEDPLEAHVAADIALRAGSFSLIAFEMHRALHPKPLGRLARLAHGEGPGGANEARTRVIVWGEPPPFVAPPSGVARTPFSEAIVALAEATFGTEAFEEHDGNDHDESFARGAFVRAPHATDRMRPLDHAPDRRASSPAALAARREVVERTGALVGGDRRGRSSG
jgi:hypothetical protein